jgi:hypothetical protein
MMSFLKIRADRGRFPVFLRALLDRPSHKSHMKMTMTNETEETLGGIEVMDNHDYEIEFDPEAATVAEAEAKA